eukprot:c17428_g1_i2.p1 GENE.c17428_g1_i2~~c17428_g1_i2.p1  ORF type:complete len:369 (+),score=115.36 c17428_g1_i2:48-1154(+)
MTSKKPKIPQTMSKTPATGKEEQLILAVKELDLSKVSTLLNEGADAKFVFAPEGVWGSSKVESILHIALNTKHDKSNRLNWIGIVKLLLEGGADPNLEQENYDWRGCGSSSTPFLMVSGISDGDEVFDLLLKHGASPNCPIKRETHSMRTDATYTTYPLIGAVANENLYRLNSLLENGANVNAPQTNKMSNERGPGEDLSQTALFIACAAKPNKNQLKIILTLLDYGADVNAEMKYLDNVHIEVNNTTDNPRSPEYISPIKLVRVKTTALNHAIQSKNLDVVTVLLVRGADKNIPYVYGDKKTYPIELCQENEELKQILTTVSPKWNPIYHKFQSKNIKSTVFSFLLVLKRQNWKLDNDVTHHIFSFL